MKVLQIGKYYPPYCGGMENFLFDLTEALNARGTATDVLCVNDGFRSAVDRYNGYTVFREGIIGEVASTPLSFSLFSRFCSLKNSYDVLHVHLPNPLANIALCANASGAPIVVHWHSDIVKQRRLLALYRPFLRSLLTRASAIIATSEAYVDGSTYLTDFKKKVRVIPLGLNSARVQGDARHVADELRERYCGKRIILSLGRFSYYKGFEYLIEAARLLPDNYVVVIGGEGSLKAKMQDLITARNIADKVVLVGKIADTDLAGYYTAADLFVLPSIERTEAFGLVQAEAMLFGKPVVSTDIPYSGVSFVNRHGETGFVVPRKNPGALAGAIQKVLDDDGGYAAMSKRARMWAMQQFRIETVVREIESLYSRIVS